MDRIKFSLPQGYAQQLAMTLSTKYPRMRLDKDGFLGIRFMEKNPLDKFLEGLVEERFFIVKGCGYLFYYKIQEVQEKNMTSKCPTCKQDHVKTIYDVVMYLVKVTKNGVDVSTNFWENGSQSEEVVGRSAIIKKLKDQDEEKADETVEEPEIYS